MNDMMNDLVVNYGGRSVADRELYFGAFFKFLLYPDVLLQ